MENEATISSFSREQHQGLDVTNLPRRFIFGTLGGGLRPAIGYEIALQWRCTCQALQRFVEYEYPFRLVTYQKLFTDKTWTAVMDTDTSG